MYTPISTPSGRTFSSLDIKLLVAMREVGFIRHSETPFRLKSGILSHVYVFGREDLTDNTHLELEIGIKIAQIVFSHTLSDDEQPCLIGIPTAGNALAQAGAFASLMVMNSMPMRTKPICHRVMREQLKQYGAHKTWVNGTPDLERHRYWMVDNVATDGQSKIEAAEKLTADGYPAKSMPCLIWIDRQQGAVERLQNEGFEQVIVAYNLLDITFAYGELGLWPKKTVALVEAEIKEHQTLVR